MSKCPVTGLECQHHKCIHVTEITNYQATEVKDMCVLCGVPFLAKEGGPDFDSGAYEIFQVINSIIGNPAQPVISPNCPTCNYSIEEFARTGKLGCGDCYEYFKKQIMPIIEQCQAGATQHVGKIPKNNTDTIKSLEAELKDAVAKENYERAAEIKEEIKKLQGGE